VNESPLFKALKSFRPARKPGLSAAERAAEASARAARVAAHEARLAECRDAPRVKPWAHTRGGVDTRQVVLAMAGSGPLKVRTIARRAGLPVEDVRRLLWTAARAGRWFVKTGRARYRLVPDWQERLFGDEVSACPS
jgi:predicted Rossmann fold nucleotide-binding protein DprA/Smf involved in DNA uptake